jgi:hypothetical protein
MCALLSAAVVRARPEPRVVALHDGLVTMTLPAGWHEIDPTLLEDMTFWTADVTGGRVVNVYEHGFRPIAPQDPPGLPQIMVQVLEFGRLRYGHFLDLPDDGGDATGVFNRFEDGIPPLVVGVAVERVSFDRSTFTLRLEHSLDLRFRGPVRVLTAAVLTERGLIAFHYVDRERRIEQGRELFSAVMDSVKIAPELAYRPRLTDRWPGLPFFAAAVFVAALLAAYLVVRARRRS